MRSQKSRPENQFVIIPVPFEATVSYGKGTRHGPAAILNALKQVETFDEELLFESSEAYGFKIAKKIKHPSKLEPIIKKIILDGQVPIVLGGEHSLTPYVVKAAASLVKDLSVLQIDAHADLRDSYLGKKHSHACAMRRTLSFAPVVQVGIRNISKEEFVFAKETGQRKKIHLLDPRSEIRLNRGLDPKNILAQLSEQVYVTLDVDALDPSIMPATGTPEPGGLRWNDLLDLLRNVAKNKKIIGFDIVELAPVKGLPSPDFTIAKLLQKMMSYCYFFTQD